MGIESGLGMELSMYKSMKSKICIELKAPQEKKFIACVKGFIYKVGEEDMVEFERLEDTVFPTDTATEKPTVFVTLIKDIKKVERIKS